MVATTSIICREFKDKKVMPADMPPPLARSMPVASAASGCCNRWFLCSVKEHPDILVCLVHLRSDPAVAPDLSVSLARSVC